MDRDTILKVLAESEALLEGHFELRSGLHSNRYFQCAKLLRFPRQAEKLCVALVEKLRATVGDDLKADGVISPAMVGILVGHEIARAKGIPGFSAQLFPVFSPTAEFPGIVFPDLPLGRFYRRVTHEVIHQTFWQGSRLLYERVRRSNPHLPRLTRWPFRSGTDRPLPILYAFSPQVVPRPHDWRDDAHVTGYWFSEDSGDWRPPERLVAFLLAGPPPVCVGFGSTVTQDRDRLAGVVFEALERSQQRAVVVGGGLGSMSSSDTLFQLDYAPYGWLFLKAAAVVHHGGAGTTGQGLRAGVPNVVVPFTSDQPFWGRRVHRLGAGPVPLAAASLSADRLAEAIVVATRDEQMRRRAQAIGQAIRAEDGVQQWSVSLDGSVYSQPVIYGDYLLVSPHNAKTKLLALDPDSGAERWTYPRQEE